MYIIIKVTCFPLNELMFKLSINSFILFSVLTVYVSTQELSFIHLYVYLQPPGIKKYSNNIIVIILYYYYYYYTTLGYKPK